MLVDAVVTDLDGTFWGTDMAIHGATHAAVDKLDRAELPLLIATGRRAAGALIGLSAAGLHNRPGILMNGALVRHQLAGESFAVETIKPADAIAVWRAFEAAHLEPLVYIDHPREDLLVGPNAAGDAEVLSRAPGIRRTAGLIDELADQAVIGFGAFGYSQERLRPIADEINRAGSATAIVGESLLEGDHGLMVQGAGVDKQTGIEAWCDQTGIDPSRIAAVGDGANDVMMLEAAAVAIVPKSAPTEIRALADYEIAPNEAGGWFEVIEILGL